MYAKYNDWNNAMSIFTKMRQLKKIGKYSSFLQSTDTVSWNGLIAARLQYSQPNEAIDLFEKANNFFEQMLVSKTAGIT